MNIWLEGKTWHPGGRKGCGMEWRIETPLAESWCKPLICSTASESLCPPLCQTEGLISFFHVANWESISHIQFNMLVAVLATALVLYMSFTLYTYFQWDQGMPSNLTLQFADGPIPTEAKTFTPPHSPVKMVLIVLRENIVTEMSTNTSALWV